MAYLPWSMKMRAYPISHGSCIEICDAICFGDVLVLKGTNAIDIGVADQGGNGAEVDSDV